MKTKIGLILLTTLLLLPGCGAKEDDKVHLIILAGQSGARGKALNSDLLDGYENSDIEIIQDGLMMPNLNKIPTLIKNPEIKELKAGYGDTSTEHGPELGIGQTLASRYQKKNGNRRAVIVKYSACGSTFVDHWYSESMLNDKEISPLLNKKQIRENPTTGNKVGSLTNNLYQIIDEVKYILEEEGYESVVDGCIFIHGEQDAKEDVNMDIYEKALEYFVTDLRSYVGDDNMPFVVTEAVTNSAKYSNKLRDIQRNITSKLTNTSFVGAKDLYSNTFESWHFDAESNMILGNRAASELISYNDDRKLKEVLHPVVEVPFNYKVELPSYIEASFKNDKTGYLKVEYKNDYDYTKLGEQEVSFTSEAGEGKLKINVTNNPYVDGNVSETNLYKEISLNDKGTLYLSKGETGLYVGAKINDKNICTDGEAWHSEDMGQKGQNDDLRVYLTTSDVKDRITLCLSSSNLFRVYDNGTSLNDTGLHNKNLVYKKFIENYSHHVTTNGLVNTSDKSLGMDMEMFISYADLGISNPDNIKICFNYSDISLDGTSKKQEDNYIVKTESSKVNLEEDINSYFAINDLLK